jgi:hypothetical protein
MRTNSKGTVIVMLVAVAALVLAVCTVAACGEETTETSSAPVASGGVAVSGMVDNPMTLTVEVLEGMGVETVTVEHPKKGEVEYTGVSLTAVLEALGVQSGATTMVLTASDGYMAEVPLADVQTSADALLAIEDGTISSVFPGLETKTWVKDIVSIEFK